MTRQLEMFDKHIAEIRAVQLVKETDNQNLGWHLEFRFANEETWHPVKIVSFVVPSIQSETSSESNEPTSGN